MPAQFDIDVTNCLANHVYGRGRTWASQQGVLKHPLLLMLRSKSLSPKHLRQYCHLRYTAVTGFEALLEAAYKKAAIEGKEQLATELLHNLRDEKGLERQNGQELTGAAHSLWRVDFLAALGLTGGGAYYNLYSFSEEDSLATLCGVLLAAEFTIPPENKIILAALQKSFPEIFPATNLTLPQQKAVRYLADHIAHDSKSHFPDLRRAIGKELAEEEIAVTLGIARFANARCKFMDDALKQLGLSANIHRQL